MEERFGIRPQPQQGESFTAYLLRTIALNENKYSHLIDFVKKSSRKGYSGRYSHQIDCIPSIYIDLPKLSNLLGESIEILEDLTFTPIFRKFQGSNELFDSHIKSVIPNLIEKNKRRFCVKCLIENGYYKLFWQIKELAICDIHTQMLTSICEECGKEQPYISDLLNEFRCFNCYDDLTRQVKK